MTWTSFQVQTPRELTQLGQVLSDGASLIRGAMEALRATAGGLAARAASTDEPTLAALNLAVQGAVSAVNALLNAFLDDLGLQLLVVPLPKKGFVRLPASNTPDEAGSNHLRAPMSFLLDRLTPVQRATARDAPIVDQVLNPDDVFIGGNAYFLRTLSESLYDAGDPNRPQFSPNSLWAYVLLVAGATDMLALLPTARVFQRALNGGGSVPADRGALDVVPSNVRGTLSSRGMRAVLEWNPLPMVQVLLSYDRSRVVPIEFAVIRSTDFRAATALDVTELFGTSQLTQGLSGRFGARVIAVRPHDAVTSRYVDEEEVPAGQTRYYHVAFKARVEPATGTRQQAINQPYGPLSRCVTITRPLRPSGLAAISNPPDWVRTSSIATIIPPMASLMDVVQEQLRTLSSRTDAASATVTQALQVIDREIERLAQRIADATVFVRQLSTIFDAGSEAAGIHATVGQGQGSTSQFLFEVIQRLSDAADPERPAFDSGDEFVLGAVILAVSPDPAAIARAVAAFELFFGGAPQDNAIRAGIDAVPAGEDVPADVPAPPRDPIGFDADMSPREVGSAECDPAAPVAAPSLDDQFRPR